jgi:hypothetical protein
MPAGGSAALASPLPGNSGTSLSFSTVDITNSVTVSSSGPLAAGGAAPIFVVTLASGDVATSIAANGSLTGATGRGASECRATGRGATGRGCDAGALCVACAVVRRGTTSTELIELALGMDPGQTDNWDASAASTVLTWVAVPT